MRGRFYCVLGVVEEFACSWCGAEVDSGDRAFMREFHDSADDESFCSRGCAASDALDKADTDHAGVRHGQCSTCGHYGDDCHGRKGGA